MSVYEQNGAWCVNITHNGKRYRRKSPDNSRKGALMFEGKLLEKLTSGELIDVQDVNKNQSFEDFSRDWIEKHVMVNNKNSEQMQKKSILKAHLIPYFGKYRLVQISSKLIIDYIAQKKSDGELALKSINNHLAVLRRLLNDAKEWGIIDVVPKFKMLSVPPQKFDYLNAEEQELLLANATGVCKEMILISMDSGLRISEMMALKWEDINFENKTMVISRARVKGVTGSPKSNRSRQIDLTDRLYNLLLRGKGTKGYIILNDDGSSVSSMTSRRHLQRVCSQAGLRKIGWHTLRHTFATRLAERGAPIIAIQQLLGHASIDMTMRYSHMSPSALKNSIDLLG